MAVMRLAAISMALVVWVGASASAGHAETIWRDRNLFASGQNLAVGDIVIVNINDISKMKFAVSTNSDNTLTFIANPDRNITSFLPKASTDKRMTTKGATKVDGMGAFHVSIPASVAEKLQYDKFRIEGVREYSFNGIANRLTVTGVVDPSFVKGRQIDSGDVANLRFAVVGIREGAGVDIKRPALKENEKASTELSEDEKQKIIVDYLKKVLNELTQ